MTHEKAGDKALLWGLLCVIFGISATVLAVLGIDYWPVTVALALVALVVMFHYEKIVQGYEPHGWNMHKFWSLLGILCIVTGLIGAIVILAFWVIRDSAGMNSLTLKGVGITPAICVNLGLLVVGLIALLRVDGSQLDT